jgi:hypothetical protein
MVVQHRYAAGVSAPIPHKKGAFAESAGALFAPVFPFLSLARMKNGVLPFFI